MAKKQMKLYSWLSFLITGIGAINWGIYGFSRLFLNKSFDLVNFLLPSVFANIVFLTVGLVGLFSMVMGIKLLIESKY